jgi:hypothetical protein
MHLSTLRVWRCLLALPLVMAAAGAWAQTPRYSIGADGFVTAADVRAHSRMGLDIAEIRGALAQSPPDFAAALTRYAFGRHFAWRDSAHSLAYFADDYHGRMKRSLPGAALLEPDPAFQHRFMSAALMGTGLFEGGGPVRSTAAEARVAAIETGVLALLVNWCRLELSEASIRGPQANNWSLANGSPKNWSELFAFWHGPDGKHTLHDELGRIGTRFGVAEHPTRALTAALAAGQVALLEKRWPEAEAVSVRASLDQAALLIFLDRVADLDAGIAAGSTTALAARAALRAAWLAAGDSFARADEVAAKALHETITRGKDAPKAADLRAAARAVAGKLGIDPVRLGRAL